MGLVTKCIADVEDDHSDKDSKNSHNKLMEEVVKFAKEMVKQYPDAITGKIIIPEIMDRFE